MGKRNPRRVVLEVLRSIARNTRAMQSSWDVSGNVYEMTEVPGDRSRAEWRKRRPDEYPENNADDWKRLAEFMRAVEHQARDLAEWAEENSR